MRTPVIIYEDNHLLIVQKPPGWLAQADGGSRPDVWSWAGEYLARHKPGRAFVGLTHRLDRPVGGVMALAKTSKGAARLSRQFRERTAEKVYLALVEGSMPELSGEIREALVREGDLTRPARPGEAGTQAILAWAVRRALGDWTLLEIDLKTGFKHQIRAQLAAHGRPVIGDVKYGGRPGGPGPAIGLWAESLTLDHPTRGERLTFTAEPWPLWPWTVLFNGHDHHT